MVARHGGIPEPLAAAIGMRVVPSGFGEKVNRPGQVGVSSRSRTLMASFRLERLPDV
jgi:hypothetical protein